MKKKQTAVEFYRTELSALVSMKESKFQTENEIFEKAKQIEKEEMESAYFCGSCDRMNDEGSFEEYYNETYGNTK